MSANIYSRERAAEVLGVSLRQIGRYMEMIGKQEQKIRRRQFLTDADIEQIKVIQKRPRAPYPTRVRLPKLA